MLYVIPSILFAGFVWYRLESRLIDICNELRELNKRNIR